MFLTHLTGVAVYLNNMHLEFLSYRCYACLSAARKW